MNGRRWWWPHDRPRRYLPGRRRIGTAILVRDRLRDRRKTREFIAAEDRRIREYEDFRAWERQLAGKEAEESW